MENKTKKRAIIGIMVLAILLAAFFCLWFFTRPETSAGMKTVTVTVAYDGTTNEHTVETDAEYLAGALTESGIVTGDTNFITCADGRTADDSLEEWWCITKGGEWLTTGAEDTPIADGDAFELTLNVGYDF